MNKTLISGRDIIVVGLQAWDLDIGSNCKNIAIEFAKHNRVLYVNSPLDRITLAKGKPETIVKSRKKVLKGKEKPLNTVQENVWVLNPKTVLESINWLKSTSIFKILNKINNKRFAKEINKAINELGFTNYLLFNDSDMFRSYHLDELLKPDLYIYYSRDNLIEVDYWKRHGLKLEPKLIAKSDLMVANSTYYTEYGKKYNKHSYYVGQGCDVSLFDESLVKEAPNDIKNIKKPIIGYIGVLYKMRLDIELLEYIAAQKPEWSIVLVGPEDENFKQSKLHQMENVYFLGSKDISELPAYLKEFDVAINPQILNPITIGNYPRKIDEYLAMGKAIVATRTKAMEIFEEYVLLAQNKEEYIPFIEKAIENNSDSVKLKRKTFAQSHTWENSVQDIYNAINEVYKERN